MRSVDELPRAALASLPTPLEDAPRLAATLGGPQLFVKRDDLTGLATGGNKARKLEFILGDALAQGADTIITACGIQSNRARMTSAACRRLGLECVLLLGGDYGEKQPIGNLMLDEIFGAEIHFSAAPDSHSSEALVEAEAIAEDLRARGRHPYITEIGGLPEPVGNVGYYLGALELAAQCHDAGFEPASLVLPCGSGCQQASIIVGLHAAGLSTRVVGISTTRSGAAKCAARVRRQASLLTEFLQLDFTIGDDEVVVDDRFSDAGHGPPDDASVEAVRMVARTEGLLIDPTYLGKVVVALPDLIRHDLVSADMPAVIWNTGGTLWVFMNSEAFARTAEPAAITATAG